MLSGVNALLGVSGSLLKESAQMGHLDAAVAYKRHELAMMGQAEKVASGSERL
jgi:hypothetical protein